MGVVMSRFELFNQVASELGYDFSGEIKVGGNYVPILKHENLIYISGQIPRVGDKVVIQGAVGGAVTLEDAQKAAKVCVMRALALVNQSVGLDAVKGVLRISVYVQSENGFTQQSEVSDGASEVLYKVFGDVGIHTRTSVGVFQLPKNAPVEIDLIFAI